MDLRSRILSLQSHYRHVSAIEDDLERAADSIGKAVKAVIKTAKSGSDRVQDDIGSLRVEVNRLVRITAEIDGGYSSYMEEEGMNRVKDVEYWAGVVKRSQDKALRKAVKNLSTAGKGMVAWAEEMVSEAKAVL